MAEKTYNYAVARIRVLEKYLLNKQTLNNMAEAKTPEEALKVLKDAGYGDGTEINVYDYEKMLSDEVKKTYALMEELVPNEKMFNVFLFKNDYHNLKVLIKQEVSGVSGEKYLHDNGTIPLKTLKESLLDRRFNELPLIMARSIEKALESYSKTQNGQAIDIILDKAVYQQMLEMAKATKNEFIIKLVKIMIDITNIKTFLRVRAMKKDYELFLEAYLEGGEATLDRFSDAFKLDHPASAFYTTKYGDICEQGFSKSFTEFEAICDNFLINYIKAAKYIHLTIEPLVAYLFAREAEIKMARIIMTSKINKIDTEIIKERLRESYV
jgi:V/A-type H+-transporting ATPase subunit C